MAKAANSFILNQKNKTITIFTNVKANAAEQKIIDFYLEHEYTPLFDKKKSGVRVEEMRNTLKSDEKALDKFNELYKSGDFFGACKVYSEFKKNK